MIRRSVAIASLLAAFSLGFSHCALAQSVTLNGAANVTVGDADDFFTDQGLPKNFDDHCDVGRDGWNYIPKGSSNGIWTGVNPAAVGPLIGPMPIPTLGTFPVYREDCGIMGIHTPLDASKYSYLSYRAATSSPSAFAVLWSQDPTQYALHGYSDNFAYCVTGACIQYAPNEFILEHADLPSKAQQTPWNGNIYGLTIWPSMGLPAGSTTKYDWLRIIDPNTSPTYNISWTTTGGGHPWNYINVFVDTDNSGYDGSMVVAQRSETGAYTVPTGILAPGTYYFYVSLFQHNGLSTTELTRSNYIGPVTINGKPTLRFRAPSRTSGPEYSRDELGDAWDMSNSEDFTNLVDRNGNPTPDSYRGLQNWSFQNGYFHATSIPDPQGFTVDTQTHPRIASNKPVNTNFYRYFCQRFQVDTAHVPRDSNIDLLNDAGFVTRTMWIKRGVPDYLGQTYPVEYDERSNTYPDYANGFMTYCYDLWDESLREIGPGWRASRQISNMRFDPMEARPPTQMTIDWIGLFAENQSSQDDTYLLKWTAADKESGTISISLYYDTDRSGFNGTLITTLNGQAVGAGEYLWNTAGVPRGTYYVYATIADGTNTGRIYSEVPIHVLASPGLVPPPAATMCDYDGDGKTDFTFLRGANRSVSVKECKYVKVKGKKKKKKKCKRVRKRIPDGVATWHYRTPGASVGSTSVMGDLKYDVALPYDGDGDGVSDKYTVSTRRATVGPIPHRWNGSYEPVGNRLDWGITNDVPAGMSDLDGDRKSDYVVFRQSTGEWLASLSGGTTVQRTWGAVGDVPVAGDYDGDGKTDLALFRPATGVWQAALSSTAFSTSDPQLFTRGFGNSEDMPLPADYDGDGKTDLGIYRPSTRQFFFCFSSRGYDCGQSDTYGWGNAGDLPVMGDYDGDGKADIGVFRPTSGQWFIRQSSNGQTLTTTHGKSTDRLVCASPRYHQKIIDGN